MEDEEVNGIIERFLDSYIDHLTEEIIWQTTREDENIGGRVLVSLIGGFEWINGLINKMVTEDKRKELEYKTRIGLKERVYKELGIEEDISYQEGTLEFSVKGGFEIYNIYNKFMGMWLKSCYIQILQYYNKKLIVKNLIRVILHIMRV